MDKQLKEQRKQARLAAKALDTQGRRLCSKCGSIKLHTHMKKDTKRPYGIQRICKDCDNVVWPKHAKYRLARLAKHTVAPADPQIATYQQLANLHTPAGLEPHPDHTLLVTKDGGWGKPDNKEWWDIFFQNAQSIGDNDLPEGLKPKPATSVMDIAPVDPAAIALMNQAIPKFWTPPNKPPRKPTDWSGVDSTLLDKFAQEQLVAPVEPPPKKRFVNLGLIPNTDIKDAVDAGTYRIGVVEESEEQTVLRRKMKRDGFSIKMIDMACKLLPKILRDLKEIDTL
jgi:hypothetical protein